MTSPPLSSSSGFTHRLARYDVTTVILGHDLKAYHGIFRGLATTITYRYRPGTRFLGPYTALRSLPLRSLLHGSLPLGSLLHGSLPLGSLQERIQWAEQHEESRTFFLFSQLSASPHTPSSSEFIALQARPSRQLTSSSQLVDE